MASELTGLKSVVKNTSGATRNFAYLGKHGRTLADEATLEVPGDIVAYVNTVKPRLLDGFFQDVIDGNLAIVSTPPNVFLDSTLAASKVLKINNKKSYIEDPSWAETDYLDPLSDGTTTTTPTTAAPTTTTAGS